MTNPEGQAASRRETKSNPSDNLNKSAFLGSMPHMTPLLARDFSFHGRLPRLPFFIRSVYIGIAATVLFVASIPLFANGSRVLWWAGIAEVILSIAVLGVSTVSLIVRR